MNSTCFSVTFEGVEARLIEVQCAIAAGLSVFSVVGLGDKAVSEARERVRAALAALSFALPSRRITVNLAPADLPKEGSHFDLPLAVAVLAALEILPRDLVGSYVFMGELALDGRLLPVDGALPAAVMAAAEGKALILPKASAGEAAWVGMAEVFGVESLADVIGHFNGRRAITRASPGHLPEAPEVADLHDVKGQERAKRALEIAAAGRHHLLMIGPPGSGKSMLARRLPGLLPPLTGPEALETSMIHSVAGKLRAGLLQAPPFCDPHHTASPAAIVGGGRVAKPGQVSLAHNGVLFLDELPEFPRAVLDTLRQPMETGEILVARAAAHLRYPCRFLLVAAANPCRCGHLDTSGQACNRAPACGADYLSRVSGPMLDRFDLRVDVPGVAWQDLDLPATGERSHSVAARVAAARAVQAARFAGTRFRLNAEAEGEVLDAIAKPDAEGRALLAKATDRFGLTARGYHRILRVARTIADLAGESDVGRAHLAEALSYRAPVSAR